MYNLHKLYEKQDEPNFFNAQDYEWATYIEANWAEISCDLWAIIKEREGKLVPYFDQNADGRTQGWQTLSFKTWDIAIKSTLQKSLAVQNLLAKFPAIVSASINLLGAGSHIAPHQGDTNGIFRCHVGLQIPDGLPICGFEVCDEKRAWQEGKILIFCDANRHWAWNYSNGNRIVFLFDIIRPEFIEQKKSICLHVRAFLLLQYVLQKIAFLNRLPHFILGGVFAALLGLLWVLYPIQKRIGVILKHD